MRIIAVLVLTVSLSVSVAKQARAAEGFRVVADTPDSLALVLRIARALDHQDGIRIYPVAGLGPVQSLTDVVAGNDFDVAITSSDTLAYMDENRLIPGFDSKLAYLVRIDSLAVHVLVPASIKSFSDLAGKRIAMAPTESESFVAQQLLVDQLVPPAIPVAADDGEAVRAVMDGRADAAILLGPAPLPALSNIGPGLGLHLISPSGTADRQNVYAPSLLTAAEYPSLIPSDQPVETVAAQRILVAASAAKGDRGYSRIKAFTSLLFSILAPEEGGGAAVNLAATVPGWTRHAAAEDILEQMATRTH